MSTSATVSPSLCRRSTRGRIASNSAAGPSTTRSAPADAHQRLGWLRMTETGAAASPGRYAIRCRVPLPVASDCRRARRIGDRDPERRIGVSDVQDLRARGVEARQASRGTGVQREVQRSVTAHRESWIDQPHVLLERDVAGAGGHEAHHVVAGNEEARRQADAGGPGGRSVEVDRAHREPVHAQGHRVRGLGDSLQRHLEPGSSGRDVESVHRQRPLAGLAHHRRAEELLRIAVAGCAEPGEALADLDRGQVRAGARGRSCRRRRCELGPRPRPRHQPVDGGPGVTRVHSVAVELDRISGAERRPVRGEHGPRDRSAVAEQLEGRDRRTHRNSGSEERVGRDVHHPGTRDDELHRVGAGELPLLVLDQARRLRRGRREGRAAESRRPGHERGRIGDQLRGVCRRGPSGRDRSRPAGPSVHVERLDQVRGAGHGATVLPARVVPGEQAGPAAQQRPRNQARRQQLAAAGDLAPHAEAHEVRAHAGADGDHRPARRGAHRGGEVDRPGGNDGVDRDRRERERARGSERPAHRHVEGAPTGTARGVTRPEDRAGRGRPADGRARLRRRRGRPVRGEHGDDLVTLDGRG